MTTSWPWRATRTRARARSSTSSPACRQHTGKLAGQDGGAGLRGLVTFADHRFKLVDLPGTYSLLADSVDEEVARDFLLFGQPDCTVVVCDATVLERNLLLVLQILEITPRVVVCTNLMDEADRKRIALESNVLEARARCAGRADRRPPRSGARPSHEARARNRAAGQRQPTPTSVGFDAEFEGRHRRVDARPAGGPSWLAVRAVDRDASARRRRAHRRSAPGRRVQPTDQQARRCRARRGPCMSSSPAPSSDQILARAGELRAGFGGGSARPRRPLQCTRARQESRRPLSP